MRGLQKFVCGLIFAACLLTVAAVTTSNLVEVAVVAAAVGIGYWSAGRMLD